MHVAIFVRSMARQCTSGFNEPAKDVIMSGQIAIQGGTQWSHTFWRSNHDFRGRVAEKHLVDL